MQSNKLIIFYCIIVYYISKGIYITCIWTAFEETLFSVGWEHIFFLKNNMLSTCQTKKLTAS